ncbi:MAG TPA: knotted carbamoyltransferase YgeW, partial [Holophaga sp.]|nr:knotted carbamoyltransferase YgeW [Holophaga sp.]
MPTPAIRELLGAFQGLKTDMFHKDFLLTWEHSTEELQAILTLAETLKQLHQAGCSYRSFDTGLAISIFRDNSTRTRFSFASACNLLGLTVQDFDEGKSQVAHGETVRETANMISFMADVIGIRDDMYIGKGNAYMHQVVDAVTEGHKAGVLAQKPTLVNLQCDIDHPTQSMADALHLINHFGGIENLKGKKVAMTWAYSPSYGKPLSVPQGIIGLLTRFGMDVVLAHPEGYEVMPEVEQVAAANAGKSGGSFKRVNSMD